MYMDVSFKFFTMWAKIEKIYTWVQSFFRYFMNIYLTVRKLHVIVSLGESDTTKLFTILLY